MKIKYTFQQQQLYRSNGCAEEDFYIAAPDITAAVSGILRLEMFIDSYWHDFAIDRETSETTAFIGLIVSGTQLRGENLLHANDVVLERRRNMPLHSAALPGKKLHRKVMIITCSTAFDALTRVLFPTDSAIIRNGGTPEVQRIFSEIQQLIKSPECDDREISVLLFRLLQELSHIDRAANYPDALLKALQYIRLHGCQHISCCELANAAGVSERALNTLFRQYLQTSPAKYLIDRRIKLAKELLSGGKFSIRETAQMCGFSTPEFFIRVFRKQMCCTPGEWKKRSRCP